MTRGLPRGQTVVPATFVLLQACTSDPCALILLDRETGALHGVKRMEVVDGNVHCTPIMSGYTELMTVDSNEPQVQRLLGAAMQSLWQPSGLAVRINGMNVWRLLNLWTPRYGEEAVRAWPGQDQR
jgi:hypothetical protein